MNFVHPNQAERVVIIGASFSGLTAAIELAHRAAQRYGSGWRDKLEIVVIAKSGEFVFSPSLVWVPFGLRSREDITFPVRDVLQREGVAFKLAVVTDISLGCRELRTRDVDGVPHVERYSYLVIATGASPDWTSIEGLGPQNGFTQSIFSLADAERTCAALERLIADPGPVVVGGVASTSCFPEAYEFLFNLVYQLDRRGFPGNLPATYLTPEPFLGHLGLGGFGDSEKIVTWWFAKRDIRAVVNARVTAVSPGEIHLSDGQVVPFKFAMLAPSFGGVDVVRNCRDVVDRHGFVKVTDAYRTARYPEVFAAGGAIAVPATGESDVPCGVPTAGYPAVEMGRLVAHNVLASIEHEPLTELAPGAIAARHVIDAGDTGIILSGDHLLEPRGHAWLVPGAEAHWAKIAFEKWFLASRKRGRV